MRTVRLVLAYDGTDFAGWQRQPGLRTVQAVLEDALAPIEGRPVTAVAAGRTDAGVHARAQIVSVRLTAAIEPSRLQRALNAVLEDDVRVMSCEQAPAGFDARFHARRKSYRYEIWNGRVMPPWLRRTAWHVPQPLSIEPMQEAASAVLGAHDFKAFLGRGSAVKTTTRTIFVSRISRADELLTYEVTGNGFLRYMVRGLIGTLAEIGRGRRPSSDMAAVLASGERAQMGVVAPPHGLTLWEVEY